MWSTRQWASTGPSETRRDLGKTWGCCWKEQGTWWHKTQKTPSYLMHPSSQSCLVQLAFRNPSYSWQRAVNKCVPLFSVVSSGRTRGTLKNRRNWPNIREDFFMQSWLSTGIGHIERLWTHHQGASKPNGMWSWAPRSVCPCQTPEIQPSFTCVMIKLAKRKPTISVTKTKDGNVSYWN